MMKQILSVLAALGLSSAAFAATDIFECKIKERGEIFTVRFAVSNINDVEKASLENVEGSEEYAPIAITPNKTKDGFYPNVATLNGQGGDLRVTETKITLFGDDDGVQYVWLTLYKNNKPGVWRGWARFQGPDDEGSWYQKLACAHTVKK